MIQIQIQFKGLKRTRETIRKIGQRIPKVAEFNLRDVGYEVTKIIRGAMRDGAIHPPLFASTMLKRKRGKLAGPGGPAIARYSGTKVLKRSGRLSQAVRFHRLGMHHWRSDIEPTMGAYSGGKQIPLSEILWWQETGYTARIKVTVQMLRYLTILFKGMKKGRKRKNKRVAKKMPKWRTGKIIEAKVLARPIFTTAFDSISMSQFDSWLEKSLQRHFRVT